MKSKHFNGLMEVFKKKIDYKYQKTDNDRMKAPLLFSWKWKNRINLGKGYLN